jgi:hypothetical protein
MKTFFKLIGCYVSRSGILHTKTLLAKFLADRAVVDGQFVYLGRNMYGLNNKK